MELEQAKFYGTYDVYPGLSFFFAKNHWRGDSGMWTVISKISIKTNNRVRWVFMLLGPGPTIIELSGEHFRKINVVFDPELELNQEIWQQRDNTVR